jgi:hypothetical protein
MRCNHYGSHLNNLTASGIEIRKHFLSIRNDQIRGIAIRAVVEVDFTFCPFNQPVSKTTSGKNPAVS